MKKTETKSTVLLAHHLKALKLPTILTECEKVANRCAADNVDHLGFLLQLCELESGVYTFSRGRGRCKALIGWIYCVRNE